MNVELQVDLETTRVKRTTIVQKAKAFLKIKSPVLQYPPAVVWEGWTIRRSYVDWPTVDEEKKTILLPDKLGDLRERSTFRTSVTDMITEHADLLRGALLVYAEATVAHTIAQNKHLIVHGSLAPRPLHKSDFTIVHGVQPQLTEEVEEEQKTFRVWFDMPELGTTNVSRRAVFTSKDDGFHVDEFGLQTVSLGDDGFHVDEFGLQTVSLGSTNMNAEDFAALTVDDVETAFLALAKKIYENKIKKDEEAPPSKPVGRPENPAVFQLSAKKTVGLQLLNRS